MGQASGFPGGGPGTRHYFGVSPELSLEEIQGAAEHYPVFRIQYAGEAGARPEEIAPGVYRVDAGRGFTGTNVYLVRSGPGWVLIDTAWPGRGRLIKAAAESLFGAGARPETIVLTHIHPDHAGSALELARIWDLPVHVHPDEMVLAPGRYLPEYGNPLDRWLIAPVLQLAAGRLVRRRRLVAGELAAAACPGGAGGRTTLASREIPRLTGAHAVLVRPL